MAEQRVVQETGRSTLTVSLPKKWVKNIGLRKGSIVYLEELPDGSLRIVPATLRSVKSLEATVSAGEFRSLGGLMRKVISLYLAGYSKISVRFDASSRHLIEGLREVIEENILGLSALEATGESITFYSVIDTSSLGLWDAIEKLVRDAESMLRLVLEGLIERDVATLEDVPGQDHLVDKLYLLISKQLTTALMNPTMLSDYGLETAAEAIHLFLAAKSVERVADHAVIIAENAVSQIREGSEIPGDLVSALEGATDLFSRISNHLPNLSEEGAREVMVLLDSIEPTKGGAVKYEDPELNRISESVGRIVGYSLDIAEAIIDVLTVRTAAKEIKGS